MKSKFLIIPAILLPLYSFAQEITIKVNLKIFESDNEVYKYLHSNNQIKSKTETLKIDKNATLGDLKKKIFSENVIDETYKLKYVLSPSNEDASILSKLLLFTNSIDLYAIRNAQTQEKEEIKKDSDSNS